jgi:hypothetical protein
MSDREAMKLALDALLEMTQPQRTASESDRYRLVKTAIAALDVALAQQAEPHKPATDATDGQFMSHDGNASY